jgi:lysozyme
LLLAACLLVTSCQSNEQLTATEPLQDREALCPSGTVVRGIDVSKYQGSIDWPTVADSGISFGIASIGDGLLLDSSFAQNWAGMADAGLVRGAYLFFEPSVDPGDQADAAVQAVGRLGAGDLPVVADVEVTGGLSSTAIAANLDLWVQAVQAGTGRTPMIYTGPGFWNSNVASMGFGNLPLFVAQWGVVCPATPTGWSSWQLWQYADNGAVPGVPGQVDLDEFNGDLAALQAFAAGLAPDAGPADAGPASDAGIDAGASDAGTSSDAGVDAGASPDAGTKDAGVGMDAGSQTDAGSMPDAGSMLDAGSAPDAGAAGDAGAPADAGSGDVRQGGCGCNASHFGPAAFMGWLLLARRGRRRSVSTGSMSHGPNPCPGWAT